MVIRLIGYLVIRLSGDLVPLDSIPTPGGSGSLEVTGNWVMCLFGDLVIRMSNKQFIR